MAFVLDVVWEWVLAHVLGKCVAPQVFMQIPKWSMNFCLLMGYAIGGEKWPM